MPDSPPVPRPPSPVSLDTNAFIGAYPYRYLPHPDPDVLVRVLAREGIAHAWVGHLPSAFHRDPSAGNSELLRALAPHADVLSPAPIVRPDWPRWERTLEELVAAGIPAIRGYPQLWGLAPGDVRLEALARACSAHDVALVLTVRFEDLRQRHALDTTPDLTPAHVRELMRAGVGGRVIVTAAGREFIEEVHWGLTPEERAHLYFDFSWLWGPPTNELAQLFTTIGSERFVYGTMWPLRLVQGPRANLALLPQRLAAATLADVRPARPARPA